MNNDFYFEELIFENLSNITEAVKDEIKTAESYIELIFTHLLKYKYQPQRQSRSWYNTFFKTYKNIVKNKNMSKTNVINGIDLDECYKVARDNASRETFLPLDTFPEQKPNNWDINFIMNINLIIEFLKDNHNRDATYNIDLDEYIKYKGF